MQDQQTHNIISLSDVDDLALSDLKQDIRGREVIDTQGEEIGKVDDLMIDEEERKVRFIRVASGGFLGMGQTKFLIPVDAIAHITDDQVRLDRERSNVAASPAYDPDIVDQIYYDRIYGHYGYAPYWSTGYVYPIIR